MRYDDVSTTDAEGAKRYLYLQVNFKADWCGSQPKSIDFKAKGVDWCVDNFKSLLNNCECCDFHECFPGLR